jgi:hypothetical protein
VNELTDDEIVDAVAKRGILGMDLDDTQDGNPIERACVELGIATVSGPDSCGETDIDVDFAGRIHDATPEEIAQQHQHAHDCAHGELCDTNALSFTDMYGRRSVFHVRCGRKLGGGRFCFRRADHRDQCDPHWEYP